MERNEEIFSAAASFANAVSGGTQDSYFDIVLKTYKEGAKWADQHPKKGLVDIDEVCRYIENCTWPIESVKDKFIFSDELKKHFMK